MWYFVSRRYGITKTKKEGLNYSEKTAMNENKKCILIYSALLAVAMAIVIYTYYYDLEQRKIAMLKEYMKYQINYEK